MSKWATHKFHVPLGPGDYWERFAPRYPEVYARVERITDAAGTWDADVEVLLRAAAFLTDAELSASPSPEVAP